MNATAEASRRGRSSRRRGAQGERELAGLLSDELGLSIKRMLGQERDGGADLHIGPLRIQVKRCERIELGKWWRQTLDDAGDDIPILAYRASRKPWMFRALMGDVTGDKACRDHALVMEMPMPSFVYWVRERVDLNLPVISNEG